MSDASPLPIDDAQTLRQVQKWMQSVLTHPHGIAAGLDSQEARCSLDVEPAEVERVITRSSRQSATERLAIYGNAYFNRLLGCLEEDFPATRHAVGEQAFAGFVFGYLQAIPPSSYTLGTLHRKFPGYLESTRPSVGSSDSPPPGGESHLPDWVDFVVDLATLEAQYVDVFDGPGEEQLPPLAAESFARLTPQEWESARLRLAQSLRLLHLRFPVHQYASAVRQGTPAVVPAPQETWLAVHRRDYVVRRRPLTRGQYLVLQALQQQQRLALALGARLSELLQEHRAATADDDVAAPLEQDRHQAWFRQLKELEPLVQEEFRLWTREGYFLEVLTSPAA